jgi:starch phosphorylase
MAQLTPRFSTNRSVREYTEQHYLPAASVYRQRAADNGAAGKSIVGWQRALRETWAALRFGEVKVEARGAQHMFEVELALGDLDPEAVRVELYADGTPGAAPVRQEMVRARRLAGAPGRYVYTVAASAARSPSDYTARVIPHREGVAVPLEVDPILWQR